jgi:hypothetical protein
MQPQFLFILAGAFFSALSGCTFACAVFAAITFTKAFTTLAAIALCANAGFTLATIIPCGLGKT